MPLELTNVVQFNSREPLSEISVIIFLQQSNHALKQRKHDSCEHSCQNVNCIMNHIFSVRIVYHIISYHISQDT